MADTRVEDEVAAAALTGAEILYCVQAGGPRNLTVDRIAAYAANPPTSDGRALGGPALQWSDAYWAFGAVQNYGGGDTVLTHSGTLLTLDPGRLKIGPGAMDTNGTKFLVNGNTGTPLGTTNGASEQWLMHFVMPDNVSGGYGVDCFGTGNFGSFAVIDQRRARGTLAAPAVCQSGDLIGVRGGMVYVGGGFNGTGFSDGAVHHHYWSCGTSSTTSWPSAQSFSTCNTGSATARIIMWLDPSGFVGIGEGGGFAPGVTPIALLHLAGNSGAIQQSVRSGGASNFAGIDIGRTAAELTMGVAGGTNSFIMGSAAGDSALRGAAGQAIFLATGGVTAGGIKLTFASGINIAVASSNTNDDLLFSAKGTGVVKISGSDFYVQGSSKSSIIDATSGNPLFLLRRNGTDKNFYYNDGTQLLITSNGALTHGVKMADGADAWAGISDGRLVYKRDAREIVELPSLDGYHLYENEVEGKLRLFPKAQEVYKLFPHVIIKGSDDPDYMPKRIDDNRAWFMLNEQLGAVALAYAKQHERELKELKQMLKGAKSCH